MNQRANIAKQVADYKTALNDLINAKGQFENFANYTQEERLNLVDKVIAKPNYNKKVYKIEFKHGKNNKIQ